MGGDTCHQTVTHETCERRSNYGWGRTFYLDSRKTQSEPAGNHKGFISIRSDETNKRSSILSRGICGPSKMQSSVRELAVDRDHEELRKALRKQSSLRDLLYGKRLQLKEKRNELRQERVLLADADGDFMKSVRQFSEQDHFELQDERYVNLERKRDLVGSLQYEFDQAEDEYDIDENELGNAEGKLNDLLSKYSNEQSETGDKHTTESSLDSRLQPEEPQYGNEEAGARAGLAEYQSRVGDARIMEERLQDLLSEQGERYSFAKKRENLGVDLGGSDDNFTEYFTYHHREIVGELDIINADIERLKDGLIQAGHVFPKNNPTDRPPENQAHQAISRPRSAHSPVARQRALSGGMMQSLQKNFAMTRAHISAQISWWILNTFGSSPVECARHKQILRGLRDESLDDKEWARLVFEHWKKAEGDGEDDLSRGSWDEILPGDLMENTLQNLGPGIQTPILLSGRSEVDHVMSGFRQQFPLDKPGDHSRPYYEEVELDKLSEYESRSVGHGPRNHSECLL